ncbi:MAG: hypothetical protein CMJ65_10715 [Planctomycetaceae bacterium]|jgi:hypothetical protein|nr:hypothetical protein [Planctomycetaceae bacterium]
MTTFSIPRHPSPRRPRFATHRTWAGLCLLGLTLGLLPGPVVAGDADKAAPRTKSDAAKKSRAKKPRLEFVRLVRDKKTKEPIRMETATVRYVLKPKNTAKPTADKPGRRPVTVDLIGVVHVGERSYYDRLNRQFEQYDALLYELVAQQGARPSPKGKAASNNPAGFLQNAMKSMLRLEHQLENIDYTKKNFVHADLSPEEMAEAMRKRGDNGLTITLGILADMIRQQNLAGSRKKGAPAAEEVDFFTLLADPNGPVKMKRMMAEQMVTMDSTGGVGKTLDRILVQDRNEAAIKVFRQQVAKGKRRLGIFYGAAHMPDFHRRLAALGFRPQKISWATAWDLRIRQRSETDDLIQLIRLLQRLSQ